MAIIQIEIDCDGEYCGGCVYLYNPHPFSSIKDLKCMLFNSWIPNLFESDTYPRCQACLESEVKSNPLDEDYILPCDVKVYPATTIAKGCKLGTLLNSIKLRENEE